MRHLHRPAGVLAVFGCVLLVAAASATSQTLTIFTVPGATQTRAMGITPSGEIAGLYTIGDVYHGFC